jgi:hypothetical protein
MYGHQSNYKDWIYYHEANKNKNTWNRTNPNARGNRMDEIRRLYKKWTAGETDNLFTAEEEWNGDMVLGFVKFCINEIVGEERLSKGRQSRDDEIKELKIKLFNSQKRNIELKKYYSKSSDKKEAKETLSVLSSGNTMNTGKTLQTERSRSVGSGKASDDTFKSLLAKKKQEIDDLDLIADTEKERELLRIKIKSKFDELQEGMK